MSTTDPTQAKNSTAATSGAPDVLPYTIPGVSDDDAKKVIDILQDRLNALSDLHLTLKHAHWNVVGPHFIGVHLMLDPQVDAVRLMTDALAERIAAFGGSPVGTPGAIAAGRTWDDYSLGRADALAHLAALDLVYDGVITSHRDGIEATEKADPVTQDILIAQARKLEQFQWFIRAHLEGTDGRLSTEGTTTLKAAAAKAPGVTS